MSRSEVIANQEKILANQDQIKRNQVKLDLLLASQETILANQEKIRELEVRLSQLLADQDRAPGEPEPIGEMIGSSEAFQQALKDALPATLIESELFGYEKGAFTGASQRKIGRFELADGGTIFLDEIGEVPFEIQGRFLRVLQTGIFERLGGAHSVRVKVRIITATNQPLEHLVNERKFRADLFYRLNVFPITLPPLRERPADIPLLLKHFVKKFSARFNRTITSISEESLQSLLRYHWPGNVRELEHLVERAVLTTESEVLKITLPPSTSNRPFRLPPTCPLHPPKHGAESQSNWSRWRRTSEPTSRKCCAGCGDASQARTGRRQFSACLPPRFAAASRSLD